MIKILIISAHSLPFDVIASYRANAYLKHFKKYGIEPTLMTHFHGMKPSTEVVKEVYEYGTVIRIPIQKSKWGEIFTTFESLPVINKMAILIRWLIGYLDPDPQHLDSYLSMKKYALNHLKSETFHVVMGIFSPHHHLRLCYQINREFDIPYILDFRDLWDNRVIHKAYKPSWTEELQDVITKYYWKKWLTKAQFFSITSEAWRNKINKFSKAKGIVVTNGYDPEDFDVTPRTNPSEFQVLYAGRLYAHQRLDIFLEGCQQFIETKKPKDFKVIFYGSDRSGLPNQTSGFLFEPMKYVEEYLDEAYFSFNQRIAKKELIARLKGSQVLLFPGMPDSPGTHLGKIFDYLASGVNILMAPDDNDVVSDLIKVTNAGIIANTPEEVSAQLNAWYDDWATTGNVEWRGNGEEINRYSRESQVNKFACNLNQL